MSIPKTPTDNPPSSTDQPRRKFLKTALAGAFAAPVVASLAVDHLTSKARAQQAYVAPVVTSFSRVSPQGLGSVNYATYRATFSQPINPSSYPCWKLVIFGVTGCGGGPIDTLYGNAYSAGDLSWSNGNQTLTISNVDETGGGQHNLGSGSVQLSVNVDPCPSLLLGANGLPVLGYNTCVSFQEIN